MDLCYGIIPVKWHEGHWEVLLIQHYASTGHWSFPKGHADEGESYLQTAERELFEETGLSIKRYFSEKGLAEEYQFFSKSKLVRKKVVYYVAEVYGELILQQDEIYASQWLNFDKAIKTITFPAGKEVCRQAHSVLPADASL